MECVRCNKHYDCPECDEISHKWIKCSDRLPPKDTAVLCYYYNKYTEVMEYWHDDEQGKHVFYNPPSCPTCPNEDVTHWMPLPKPPEE